LDWDYQGCDCPCRHLMRMLCRQHPYVPPNDEEPPSKKKRTQ
jgi:hypothetical protein